MNRSDSHDFLLNNCGTVIKHLLLTSINDTKSETFNKNYNDLLRLPGILYWKERIPTRVDITTITGSNDSCFENSFGKLSAYGLNTNDILPKTLFMKYLSFLKEEKCNSVYDSLARRIVASYFFASGYSDEMVDKILRQRIKSLHNFVINSPIKFDIYSESSDFKIPSQYKGKKLVNPILHQDNDLMLPLVYDIFIFYHIYDKVPHDLKRKIDTIIEYISDSRYQAFNYGYGLINEPKNKFHFIGWSAHLPFYNENLSTSYFEKGLIYRMVLFSKFKNPSIQKWIKKMLNKLNEFKIDAFQYCFPTGFLPEIKNSYFMNGRHMGLGENRNKKPGRIVESSYYVYEILKNR
jgi:hypothetical protein